MRAKSLKYSCPAPCSVYLDILHKGEIDKFVIRNYLIDYSRELYGIVAKAVGKNLK